MKHIIQSSWTSARVALLSIGIMPAVITATGCGSEDESGNGSLTVLLEGEEAKSVRHITDGWAALYDQHIVTVGDIHLRLSANQSIEKQAAELFVVDLAKIPESGLTLWNIEGLRSGRWDFNYKVQGANSNSVRHDSVTEKSYQAMTEKGWSYYVSGELKKSDGESCPPASLANPGERTPNGKKSGGNDCYDAPTVRFMFGASATTAYGPCEIDNIPGVSISGTGNRTVSITIHADHLFFNGFAEGNESGVTRLAQWLADCDLNLDGTVTEDELKAIAPGQLPQIDERFQLGGSPLTPLDTMARYVESQLMTQGHFQGEGECPMGGGE